MARQTIASIRSELCLAEAHLEAERCARSTAESELAAANVRIAELEAELLRLQQHHSDAVQIKNRGELMALARKLSAEGVPCSMRGGFLYHSRTKAVLAQIM